MTTATALTPTSPEAPAPPRRRPVLPSLAADASAAYVTDAPSPAAATTADTAGHGAPVDSQAVRDAVCDLARSLDRLQALVGPGDRDARPGDFGALTDLLGVGDRLQAVAVSLADRVLAGGLAARATGLGLEAALALETSTLHGERRRLAVLAEALRHLPVLAGLWHRGQVSTGTVNAIVGEVSRLPVAQRAEVDGLLPDLMGAPDVPTDGDRLVEQVRDGVDRRLPRQAEAAELRSYERRFLAVQPGFDGSLSLYGELDAEGGAIFLEALEAAAPPPVLDDRDATAGADAPDATREEVDDAGQEPPGSLDRRLAHRARGRQRADGLVRLAESFLEGSRADGQPRRARPRLLVWTDIATLTGESGEPGRALAATVTGRWALTPTATRRLASDADLQFILANGTEVLGVSAPTSAIPARVRAAVAARDQGCRFPRCRAPIHWCDLHHVVGREDGGWTIVQNLVALCRRHHTAVTQGRWRLTMTADGVVTVRRGRRRHTSDPPARAPAGPGSDRVPAPAGGSFGSDPPT